MPESPISNAERLSIIAGAFDVMPDAIVVVDGNGVIVLINKHAKQIFGAGAMAMEGQVIECLLPESLRGVHESHRIEYKKQPRTRSMGVELDLKAKRLDSGEEFKVKVELCPMESPMHVYTLATIRRMD